MSNLTLQSTPKSYLEQYPVSTGQIALDEEGIVVGNSGDLNTCLFEGSLNTKIGVSDLDEAKTLLDTVPVAPMPPEGGITFVTNLSGAMSVILTLCTASTQALVGGNVTINWGDGSAIQTFTIANPGPTTCTKTASYSTTDQKLVTITCVTTTHSILSFTASSKGILSIDGRNCSKLTTLDVSSNASLKTILGFIGVITVTCDACTSLTSLPNWIHARTVACSACTLTSLPLWKNVVTVDCNTNYSLTTLPNWPNVTTVTCYGCHYLTSLPLWSKITTITYGPNISPLTTLPNWPNITTVSCTSCTVLTSFPLWQNVVTVNCSICTSLTSLPLWPKITTITCNSCTSLTSLPDWPNIRTITCTSCSNLLSVSNWVNVTVVRFDICSKLTALGAWPNITTIECDGCIGLTNPGIWFDVSVVDPWPKCNSINIGWFLGGVGFGSNSTYLNNFYTLLHDWSPAGAPSGTLRAAGGNSGYAASDKTIATNKDWTVS